MSTTKFTYTEDYNDAVTTEIVMKTDSDKITDIVEDFARFLRACGFGDKSIEECINT